MIAHEEELLPHSLLTELDDESLDCYSYNCLSRFNTRSTNERSGSSQEELNEGSCEVENKEQLQNTKTKQRYYLPKECQLKELVSMSSRQFLLYLCTAKGSAVLQKKLRNLMHGKGAFLLAVMLPCMQTLMMDSFANYFCTDLFKKCTVKQRLLVLQTILPYFVKISQDCYGTHPIQSLISLADSDEELTLILHALSKPESLVNLACDKAGNNVIQKVIVSVPEERREYFNSVLLQYLHKLIMNANGICVVKAFICSNLSLINRQKIVEYLNRNFMEICKNDYGNFAIQYIIECWGVENFLTVYNKAIVKNIIKLCINRCSSHVVEKIMDLLDGLQKKKFIYSIFSNDRCYILLDYKYGICILKKMINNMNYAEREMMKAWIFNALLISNNANNNNTERLMKLNYLQ